MNDILMTPEEAMHRAHKLMQPLYGLRNDEDLATVRAQLALELLKAQEEAATRAINAYVISQGIV